jgi:protein involved in polysaccharide export with SLBB domain
MMLARRCGAMLLLVALALPAAAQTPTAEQLEIFRNLTPEQQQALLQQVDQDRPASSTSATSSATRRTDAVAEEGRRRSDRAEAPKDPDLLKPSDTLVLQFERLKAEDQETQEDVAERTRLELLEKLIRSRNPYLLDRDAQLILPGFAPIPLGGLTEQQATLRLGAEPQLRGLKLEVTRLPLLAIGERALKPFGYELFKDAPSTFSPVTDAPVPADYVVGPGDQFSVQLFGNQNRSHNLVVSRDGTISFPELGPIRVGGLTFNAARRAIESRVQSQMIGVQANVTMGDTRSIRVFVLGEARVPGSYTVSGLSTMTTALFASGGVKEIGSLRDIQLRRQGELVRRLDLYDMLIRGDTGGDAKLLPGDVIFIPPVGPTVSIDGEVRRPAVYELRGESSAEDLVRMAGGLTPSSDPARANLTRIDESSRRVVLDVNLREPAGRGLPLRNGDVLRVSALRPQLDSGVLLDGFVHRPGAVAWREGLKLTDVIASVEELKPDADQRYVLIRRESGADRRVSVLSADLAAAIAAPSSAANVGLQPRDRITVFDLGPGRERIIEPLIRELELQSDLTRPTEVVGVGGNVKVPGQYPLEPAMRISDLLRAGGNLDVGAYGAEAELTRYTVNETGARQTELFQVDLAAVRRGDAAADLPLLPFDYLLVKETPDWGDRETIILRGEVKFPGKYPIRKGETLVEVLQRAGGLTNEAFAEGSAFTRQSLRQLEQQQLDRLRERMRQDLIALSLQSASAGQTETAEALQAGQSMLDQLQSARATGRFVIDLPGILASRAGGELDVVLRDGDELYIPQRRQEVTVIGEVQNSSSHFYRSKLKRTDYIAKSGGTTRKADRGRIYVVNADGSVATEKSIRPGDTIVVPLDAERMPRLPFWQAVTQILYNVAVSVAAVNSF